MNKNILNKIDKLIENYHVLKHPFYNKLSTGDLPVKSLKNFAIQYSHHVSKFPRYISAIHSNCDQIKIRQLLLENLNEEENKNENHPELWYRFMYGLGINFKEINEKVILEATHNLDRAFCLLSKSEKYHIGLAALYCYEYMQPEVSVVQKQSIKKYYNIKNEDALRYFTVHMSADKRHRKILRKIVMKLCDSVSKENDIIGSVKIALGSLNNFLSVIFKSYNTSPQISI